MGDLPSFDEIHVVSDIHMGGKPGFQILREAPRLAKFIRWVASRRPAEQVALLLNGDVIDTLAEDIGGYVAVDDAVSTVSRIMDDPAFRDVWAALADFVHVPGRTLVFVIGNHDVELAFPPVQRLLLARLGGSDPAARGRIEFSTSGAGHACQVGAARVFCIHGNEVDAWNYNRYEDLAKVSRRLNAGLSMEAAEWQPNAGTRMVKEVMNEVKRKYAWIDLLKPETSAAVGALLVLDPSQARKIPRLFGVVGELRSGSVEIDKRLSADGMRTPLPGEVPAMTLDQILGPNLGRSAGHDVDDMLLAAERELERPSVVSPAEDQQLGTGQLLWERMTGWVSGIGKDEALRRALVDWLEADRSFDVGAHDDTFKQVSSNVGPSLDFIVTGHTHLERAIDMGGGRFYFNTGTWIRLLRLSDAVLRDPQAFRKVYDVLVDGRMQAIDSARLPDGPLVLDRSTAVCISADREGVTGTLSHVDADGVPHAQKRFVKPS